MDVAPLWDWLPIPNPSPPLLSVSWILSFLDFLSLRLVLLVPWRSRDGFRELSLSKMWTALLSIASFTRARPFSLGKISSFYLKIKAGTFQSSSASSKFDFERILAISSGRSIMENTFLQNFSSYACLVISLSRSFFSSTCSLFRSLTSLSWFLYLFCSFFIISRWAVTSLSRFW